MPRVKGVKMYVAQVFDWLTTAPEGAVVVYRVTVDDDSHPALQDFFVATLDDGNLEVAWGVGTAPEDALEVASREWQYLMEGHPDRGNDPFREALGGQNQEEDKEEETND